MNRTPRYTFVQMLVVITLIAVVTAFVVPAIGRARDQANFIRCKDNLRRIGSELILYANANGGQLPVSAAVDSPHLDLLQSLAASHCLADPFNYYCPSQRQPSLSYSPQNFASGVIGYYYYCAQAASSNPNISKFLRSGVSWPRKLNMTMDPKSWVMSDYWISAVPTSHSTYRKGINFLTLDGSVDFVGESPRQVFH